LEEAVGTAASLRGIEIVMLLYRRATCGKLFRRR